MKKKRLWIIIAAALCVCVFAACGNKGGEISSPSSAESAAIQTTSSKPSETGDSFLRTDSEGLVQVRIENGEASLAFDFERWEALYQINSVIKEYYYNPDMTFHLDADEMQARFFPVSLLSGKVKDACVGQVAELDLMDYPTFVTPAVVFLMEDGGLEWVLADPLMSGLSEVPRDTYHSNGRIPWVSNITALSAETEAEDSTIVATDTAGSRIDLRHLCLLTGTFNGTWSATLIPNVNDPSVVANLRLHPDGSAMLKIGYENSELLEDWFGTYEVFVAEGQKHPPGTIVFDLAIGNRYFEGSDSDRLPQTINGSYRFTSNKESTFDLYLNDGDPLCPTFTIDEPNHYGFRMISDSDEEAYSAYWDEEKLIHLWLADGVPTVSLNTTLWEEHYGIYETANEFGGVVNDGEIAVNGLSGKVSEVVIGKVPAIDWNMFYDFNCHAVFLLMEDGTVEWFLADPISYGEAAYDSRGTVPWLNDIVSLSFENGGEGIGDMTVYATDSKNNRFDLRTLCNFSRLFDVPWICRLDSYSDGVMWFYENGKCEFEIIHNEYMGDHGHYTGNYSVSADETHPDIVTFELMWKWDEGVDGVGDAENAIIEGRYFLEMAPEGFTLYRSDGNYLYELMEEFYFVTGAMG